MTPAAQISTETPYPDFYLVSISGAIYYGSPIISFNGESILVEFSKPPIFTIPSLSIKMFSNLRFLWTMFFE